MPKGGAATVRVEGLKELQRELRAVSKEAAKDLRQANLEGARIVAIEAQRRAPERSGRLRRSIRATATQRGAAVKAGGARVPYASVIHFGLPKRHIHANPFIYDAADNRRADVIRRAERAIDELISRHNL